MKQKKINLEDTYEVFDVWLKGIRKLDEIEDRAALIDALRTSYSLFRNIQAQNQMTRLVIWECTYALLHFLYKHGQLRRDNDHIDYNISKLIDRMLKSLECCFVGKKSNLR